MAILGVGTWLKKKECTCTCSLPNGGQLPVRAAPSSSSAHGEGGDTGYYHTVAFWVLGSLLKIAQSP